MTAKQRIQVHPASPERWGDVAAVMGSRGDPSHCWCQFFRLRGKEWQVATREDNKRALRDQVQDSPAPPGVLAYLDDEPVGWCAIAPKTDYPRVVASPVTGNDIDGIWSITCFVVRVGHRRRGVAAALLPAAVELARSHGAAIVEAYPVDASVRKSISAAELYRGPLALFRDAGFTEVGRPSSARTVVQLPL